jgi:hypothetical protein
VHDHASHGADSFRYLAIGQRDEQPRPARSSIENRLNPMGSLSWMAS